jgi:glycosyltransferase involved in cell wall biosynthesis
MIRGKFSIIVAVYKTPNQMIERCIKSLLDQDYKNYEIIAVLDGPDKEAEKTLKKFPEVKVNVIEHGGAPRARNYGKSKSDGEFLMVFDPDCELFPGALRTYANAFNANPDVDFVYGGYRFYTQDMYAFASEEFDPWRLTIENYVSGCSPVRASMAPEWDENFKSLQDWDYFLTIVDRGGKGKFLNDYFFITELPRGSNISMDSHDNWEARVKQIKDKHNIPDNKICVSSLGAPFHAKNVARVLGADYKQWISRKPHHYETIYSLGFYPFVAKEQLRFPFVDPKTIGTNREEVGSFKKIIHWIGTDILQMKSLKWSQVKDLVGGFKTHGFIHLCEFEQTQKELKELGIDARVVPLPYYDDYKPIPLPEEFVVAIYDSGAQQFDIYNNRLMEDVAYSMPDVKFIFFGDPNRKHKIRNWEYVGRVDMKEFLPKVSCNLRITAHDGLPITPCEFVMAGRHSIVNVNLPYMDVIPNSTGELNIITYPEAKKNIVAAIRRAQKLGLNLKGSRCYREMLSPDKFKKSIEEVLK